MRSHRRIGRRAPLLGLGVLVVLLVWLPAGAMAADWSEAQRVSTQKGSRIDSLHQLAAGSGSLHLLHPRIGPDRTDDRVVYQRSDDGGSHWSGERVMFSAGATYRLVVPNLALAARGDLVVAAWRATGPGGASLFVRVSRDGGRTFAAREELATSSSAGGLGVPAAAVGDGVISIAWTDRGSGKVKVRSSRDGGRRFSRARTLGTTKLSIDCRRRITDGLVGLASVKRHVYVAWSYAGKRSCHASSIKLRASPDRGASWNKTQVVTRRRSYGWPELDARGSTVVATIQSPTGGLIVARSGQSGRAWTDRLLKAREGHSLSAADVVLLPRGKAVISYVDERVRKARLLDTSVVARKSPNDGGRYGKAQSVTGRSKRLRIAPNLAANGNRLAIVFQGGPLDASRSNLYWSRPQ